MHKQLPIINIHEDPIIYNTYSFQLSASDKILRPALTVISGKHPTYCRYQRIGLLNGFCCRLFFAPSIKYKGVEDIRFTPGWGKAGSEEYWTYAFLWFLDDEPFVNNEIDP